jgi:hypothetical protein
MTGHRTGAESLLNMVFWFADRVHSDDGRGRRSGRAVLADSHGVGWIGLIRSSQGTRA